MRLFNPENAIWRTVGNIADMFLLSLCWYASFLGVVTAGAGITGVYYASMKLTANQEDYTLPSFLRSFRRNFRQATVLWLGSLILGGVLAADIYWALTGGSRWGFYLLPGFLVIALLFLMVVSFLFPLLARCDDSIPALVKLCVAMTVRNFLPVFSALLLSVGLLLAGVFLFWPLLLIAPGLAAYVNSFSYNRILAKYGFGLGSPEKER